MQLRRAKYGVNPISESKQLESGFRRQRTRRRAWGSACLDATRSVELKISDGGSVSLKFLSPPRSVRTDGEVEMTDLPLPSGPTGSSGCMHPSPRAAWEPRLLFDGRRMHPVYRTSTYPALDDEGRKLPEKKSEATGLGVKLHAPGYTCTW
ncbi:hypothetical protein CRG98_042400 [Punica granatum]|uniref:Uncharacterized protein n=1 Tax=Punica granatum TaxID=22663 RepID=A0A2I0HZR5_PUNGR|nr:hypothetical protein CRG98_042400 [Punica granatum]